MKVKALSTYKDLNIIDSELGRIPNEGEEFIVKEDRLKVLLGANTYNRAFVEVLVEKAIEPKKEVKKRKHE